MRKTIKTFLTQSAERKIAMCHRGKWAALMMAVLTALICMPFQTAYAYSPPQRVNVYITWHGGEPTPIDIIVMKNEMGGYYQAAQETGATATTYYGNGEWHTSFQLDYPIDIQSNGDPFVAVSRTTIEGKWYCDKWDWNNWVYQPGAYANSLGIANGYNIYSVDFFLTSSAPTNNSITVNHTWASGTTAVDTSVNIFKYYSNAGGYKLLSTTAFPANQSSLTISGLYGGDYYVTHTYPARYSDNAPDTYFGSKATHVILSGGSNPTVPVTITYSAPPAQYDVSIADCSGGTVAADKTQAAEGDTVSLTVTPDTDRQFKTGSLKYADALGDHAITGTNFIMPGRAVTVSAEFEPKQYTIGVSASSGGLVTADRNSSASGQAIGVTVTPDTGKHVRPGTLIYTDSSGDHAITGGGFTMPQSNITLSAQFETPVSIITNTLAGGMKGSAYTATVSALDGWAPYQWSTGGLPDGLAIDKDTGEISGTPKKSGRFDLTLTVTDTGGTAAQRTLSLYVINSGTDDEMLILHGYGGGITDNHNGTYIVEAITAGYVIDQLWVDGFKVSIASGHTSYEVTSAEKSIVVTFAYTANFTEPANGTLTVASAGETITSGQIVRGGQQLIITAVPEAGYVLESLTVNGEDVTDYYTDSYLYTVGTKGTYRTLDTDIDTGTQGAQIAASFTQANTLISITQPAAITDVLNGTAKTAAALGLPNTVTMIATGGSIQASVLWNVASSTYDPSNTAAQVFTVNGAAALPDGVVNLNSVSLATSINISVDSAALVPVIWQTAVADGAVDTVTSAKIDLIFDTPIAGLTADSIAITNGTGAVVKGGLTGSGANWSIALDDVSAQGNVSAAVTAPAGYTLSGSPKTVLVYKAAVPTPVIWQTAVADGAVDTVTSTKIDLIFDTSIAGLTADSIVLTNGTGAVIKGGLTGGGANWSIALDDVSAQGDVFAAVTAPAGYALSGSPKTVTVYKAAVPTPVIWQTAVANGAVDTVTSTKIDLTFDTPIAGLTADSIVITNGTGAVVKGGLTGIGANWSIALDDVSAQGNMSAAITAPAGYTLSGSPKTIVVYKAVLPSGTAPVITTEVLQSSMSGIPYSQTLAAEGDMPVSWSIENGSLPTGLVLSGDTIAGTPTAAGTFSFIVKAQNIAGSDTKALGITITPASYIITASAGPGGSISPSGPVSIAAGGSQAFTITPDTGYNLSSVMVDSVDQGPLSSYSFIGVSADHAIQAAFVPAVIDEFALGIREAEAASIFIFAEGLFKPSAVLTVTALPDGESSRQALEALLHGKNTAAAFEVSIAPGDAFMPPLTLRFHIGEQYNGRTVYILHRLYNGNIEQFSPTVANGEAAITVQELSPFVIMADPWIVITAQPQNVFVAKGQTATFAVSAQSESALSYQWQKKTGSNAAWANIPGAVNPEYVTSQTTLANKGFSYRVVITDALNHSAISNAATLMVVESPDTGDYQQPALYAALMILFLVLVYILYQKRKVI